MRWSSKTKVVNQSSVVKSKNKTAMMSRDEGDQEASARTRRIEDNAHASLFLHACWLVTPVLLSGCGKITAERTLCFHSVATRPSHDIWLRTSLPPHV